MFTSPRRPLVFPLKEALANEIQAETPEPFCEVPVFPEDSDEKITVLFRLSLNDFVALASAIDVGSDIAYGLDAVKIWQLWVTAYMCAQFCDEVALCLTSENAAVVAALANLLTNNQTILNALASSITSIGSAVPGTPITPGQAASDITPGNVRDEEGNCIDNNLWGAISYLVQSGNRAITDFFEATEAATNNIEMSGIIAQNVPAAGGYAASALEFADQIQETLQEGYAAAYTETYENDLACEIFCLARENCEVTPDMLIGVMESRLGYVDGTLDFGVLMNRVGSGVFVGETIADCAFYIYFTALKFGQQFMGVLGFRPLTDMMSLGADLLASDNWNALCECGSAWSHTFDDVNGWGAWTIQNFDGGAPAGQFVTGGVEGLAFGIGGVPSAGVVIRNTVALTMPFNVTIVMDWTDGSGAPGWNTITSAGYAEIPGRANGTDVEGVSEGLAASAAGVTLQLLSQYGGGTPGAAFLKQIVISASTGTDPY